MTDFSLADLTALTGAKRRSVQLWAEAGVLQADLSTERAGTGVHRRFARDEAMVALLVAPFADLRVSIGMLKLLGDQFRQLIAGQRHQVEACLLPAGDPDAHFGYLLVSSYYGEKVGVKSHLRTYSQSDIETAATSLGAKTMSLMAEGGSCICLYLNKHLAALRHQ